MLTHHTVSDFAAATDWVVAQLRALAPGPFERPVVLAEHPTQWRAITMALATDSGCFASVRLLTPTGWVDETLKLEGERREWRPRAMTWRIVDAITTRVSEMPPTAKRIIEAGDGVALHEFARQVAERFWDYLRYRPELPLAWEQGDELQSDSPESEAWQRILWRELCARTKTMSPAQRIAAVRREGVTLGDDVPAVVHVIAGTRIPPVTQELLERIAERREVHCCALTLATRAPSAPTVTLNACHSALREVETLRELAVQALHEDATLRPDDITLYLSDVTAYASAVEAVFDVDEPGMPRIPYSIAGRPFREASPVVRTVLQLVDAADGRGTLDEIGGLLRLEPVARAAGFDDEDVAVALDLATRAGITWGRDGATRAARHGLPEVASGTWRHGVDRLVLGVATGRTLQPVDDILPVAGETGGNAELVGRLAAWSERVFALCDAMQAARSAEEWTAIIERVLREFVHTSGGDDAEAARNVRAALQSQLEAIAEATPGTPLTLATMRALLARALED
ncbi:MAG TPA: exodeoxyribonuclease V subunit gamma, partial [Gemmatimonadaceae bacterium]|nr:exodeoxyribonuclease V subunit gamma [Gemmatimonadaceae bacterium]